LARLAGGAPAHRVCHAMWTDPRRGRSSVRWPCILLQLCRGALHGTLLLPPSFPLLKWAATAISYMSGIPGGIFAPSLSVGAGLAYWFVPLFPHLPISALAMLCMAAYFSGVVQSPITAAVIVLEMTNNIEMTVAVSAAAALGTIFSRMICPKPIYAAMSEQFIAAVGRRKSESLAGPKADSAQKLDSARTATYGALPVGRQRTRPSRDAPATRSRRSAQTQRRP
jgi:hypothetical protein